MHVIMYFRLVAISKAYSIVTMLHEVILGNAYNSLNNILLNYFVK